MVRSDQRDGAHGESCWSTPRRSMSYQVPSQDAPSTSTSYERPDSNSPVPSSSATPRIEEPDVVRKPTREWGVDVRAAEEYAMGDLDDEDGYGRRSMNGMFLRLMLVYRRYSPLILRTGHEDSNSASEPLLFNGFSSAREHPAGYEQGRNSIDGFDHLLPEGQGAKSTLMAGIANVSL